MQNRYRLGQASWDKAKDPPVTASGRAGREADKRLRMFLYGDYFSPLSRACPLLSSTSTVTLKRDTHSKLQTG